MCAQSNAYHYLENITFHATGAHFEVNFRIEFALALQTLHLQMKLFVRLVLHVQPGLLFVVHENGAEMRRDQRAVDRFHEHVVDQIDLERTKRS